MIIVETKGAVLTKRKNLHRLICHWWSRICQSIKAKVLFEKAISFFLNVIWILVVSCHKDNAYVLMIVERVLWLFSFWLKISRAFDYSKSLKQAIFFCLCSLAFLVYILPIRDWDMLEYHWRNLLSIKTVFWKELRAWFRQVCELRFQVIALKTKWNINLLA